MASMTFAGAVAALKTAIEAIPGTGRVHDYRRVIGDLNGLAAVLKEPGPDGKLNGGFISIQAVPDATRQSAGYMVATFRLRYEMLRGLEDALASEKTFRDTVFAVFKAINSMGLFYTNAGVSSQEPMLVNSIGGFEPDGGGYFHYADLTVDIKGRVLPAS